MSSAVSKSVLIQHPTQNAGFGIYVHWPFCAAKCPYCDFNSHVREHAIDQERFSQALVREIIHMAQRVPGRTVKSIFFGGGTPSLMEPSSVERILKAISDNWSIDSNAEITMEANPVSTEVARFADYRSLGINRLSLGVQAFDDEALHRLGRIHDKEQALQALDVAAQVFDNYSFDLIYARPGQTTEKWRRELKEALHYVRAHISLYQLTIEEGTRFFRLFHSGRLELPDEEEARILYEVTQEECEKHGLPAYEVSNHAKAEYESRHNMLYWRYGEYVGAGPGAHGRLVTAKGRFATRNERNPEKWQEKVESQGHALVECDELTLDMQSEEFVMMGMRLQEGIALERFKEFSGRDFDPAKIDDLVALGLVTLHAGRISATRQGFLVLNVIISQLL